MDQFRAPDEAVAVIATRQHGAISTTQLHACGLSPTAIRKRCENGRLHRLHRGVYAVGHIAPSLERGWMAAVLALGDGAALSHRSAAELWGLLPEREGPVDVSVRGRRGRRARSRVRVHRPISLEPTEATRRRGIPVTSPARTLGDLRRVAGAAELRRAIRQADVLGLDTGPGEVSDRARSELERAFLQLCRRHRLPIPQVNRRIGPLTVDFCWVEQRLVVETDGYRYHRGRQAFEDDRDRDLRLRARGYDVVRLSYRQVLDESVRVATILRAELRLGAP